jgi:DNA topoisomerase-1
LLLNSADSAQTIVGSQEAAESAGLRYVSDGRLGIRRRKAGKGFTYRRVDGSRLSEPDVLKRIKALAVPPAWTELWICPFVDGHVQATGRDAKGRKQYRYSGLSGVRRGKEAAALDARGPQSEAWALRLSLSLSGC